MTNKNHLWNGQNTLDSSHVFVLMIVNILEYIKIQWSVPWERKLCPSDPTEVGRTKPPATLRHLPRMSSWDIKNYYSLAFKSPLLLGRKSSPY